MSDVVQKLWGFCHMLRQDGIDYSDYIEQNLAKAFRGELVPTEAELARREGCSYESASALLERIKAERAEAKPVKASAAKRKQGPHRKKRTGVRR